MNLERLSKTLVRHEGLRLHPYLDSVGKLTIGVGRNLDDVGISRSEAHMMLMHDITLAEEHAKDFWWFDSLNDVRQEVIVNMIFNLGLPRFLGFKKTIRAIEDGNFIEAAAEMMDSKWASQVGTRAVELSTMMETGRECSDL